nr:nmra-like family domain-containing protein 1 [Quercus suber]
MATPKLLVVVGATGQQGGSVASLYSKNPAWRVRGLTRNPSSAAATALAAAGIEVVAADLDNPASLSAAFAGAHAIFGVTDFWQFLQDPATFAAASARGLQPNEIALERELQQGRNLVTAAQGSGTLQRLVLSTLSDTPRWTRGAIRWNLHFDGKARVTALLHSEFPTLAARTSFLQMGWYLSNWKMTPTFAPHRVGEGRFMYRRAKGVGDQPIPYVNPGHDTGYFVQALLEKAPAGSTMLGYCRLMNMADFAKLWGQLRGVECELRDHEAAPDDSVPEWLAQEVNASQQYVTNYGWAGGDPEVKGPEALGVDMSQLTDLEQWIREEDYGDLFAPKSSESGSS